MRMRILFLGPKSSPIVRFLRKHGHKVDTTEMPLQFKRVMMGSYDLIISYGYRHIVPEKVLERFKDRVLNLHISMLPHNRGADPNLWSWIDRTPKGVTLHLMDEGIDTGPILNQKEVLLSNGETLASSYEKLNNAAVELFKETWPNILRIIPQPQEPGGSYHKSSDKERVKHLLTKGWETPVAELYGC